MTPDLNRRGLRFTWIGLLGAICTLVMLPSSPPRLDGLERLVFWPTLFALERLEEWRGWKHPSALSLAAAMQVLLMGMLADGPRWRRWWCDRPRFRLRSSDPLAAWKALALITGLVTLTAFWSLREVAWFPVVGDLQDGDSRAARRQQQLGLRLDSIGARDPDAMRVVVIGDSLVNTLLTDTDTLTNGLQQVLDRPIELVSLAQGGALLTDFRSLLDRVASLQADIVMVESNLLFLETGAALRERRDARLRLWANLMLDRIEGPEAASFEPPPKHDRPTVHVPGMSTELDPEDLKLRRRRWTVREASRTDPSFLLCQDLFKRVKLHGGQPVVFEVPPSQPIRDAAPRFFHDKRRLAAELAVRVDGDWIPYPETVPDEWYRDAVHMNVTGRERYFEWLSRRLVRVLASVEHE